MRSPRCRAAIAPLDLHDRAAAPTKAPRGLRGNEFYAGYFRDADGNKLNVFYYG
jgi:hypothetical protein